MEGRIQQVADQFKNDVARRGVKMARTRHEVTLLQTKYREITEALSEAREEARNEVRSYI